MGSMMGTRQTIADATAAAGRPQQGSKRRRRRPGADVVWALAFLAPYAAVFLAFAAYPIGYALWMGSTPSLYAELLAEPVYVRTAINTVLYVGLGVNPMMFLALLLSGFFLRRRWWIKAALGLCMLPWTLSAIPAFTSFHWMLISRQGLLDTALSALFGIDGPIWLIHRWLALGADIVAAIWKGLPFWTLIFVAARLAIPPGIYEAAEIDGATDLRRFVHITLPLLANVYLVCTLLASIWMLGDFTTVHLVSDGLPDFSTDVLATLSVQYAFNLNRPELGVAAALSALPVLIPIVIVLMHRIHTREVLL